MNIGDAQRQKQKEVSLFLTFKSLTDFIAHDMTHNDMVRTRQVSSEFKFQFLLELVRTGRASAFAYNEITG